MANELRVLTNFLGGLIEDDPLSATASILTSASLAAMPVIDTTNHMPITLDPDALEGMPEIAWVTAHASGATTATILRGQEGTTALDHSKNIVWLHAATLNDLIGVYRKPIVHTLLNTGTGTYTTASTTWTAVDTTSDIALPAKAGDLIEIGFDGVVQNGGPNDLYMDVAIVNGAGAVLAMTSGNDLVLTDGEGWPGAYMGPSSVAGKAPTHFYTVQSGDVVSGKVNLRLMWRVTGTSTGSLFAQGGDHQHPQFWARNYG